MNIEKNELGQIVTLDDLYSEVDEFRKHYDLRTMIAVYSDEFGETYNEIYHVSDQDQLSGPYPITEDDISEIIRSSNFNKEKILVSVRLSDFKESERKNRLISVNAESNSLTWFQKQRVQTILYPEISEKPIQITAPNLLMRYEKQTVYMHALSENFNFDKFLNKNVQLYRAPFPNVYKNTYHKEDGSVCMGSVKIDISSCESIIEVMDTIDKSFWVGSFNQYHNGEEKSFVPYFESCAKAKKPLPFPYKLLKKTSKIIL